jgi:hypothetical protein
MTQAVNLANFANNLDSSGGLSPSALNSATPISKGGTGATTAAGAATNLATEFGKLLYPVGSIYINASVATDPATLLGFGTWAAFGAGRVPVGTGSGFTAGSTGGSADAVVVSHTHTASTAAAGSATGSISGYGPLGTFYSTSGVFSGSNYQYDGMQGASGRSGNNTANLSIPDHTHGVTVNAAGASATNANLQPYIVVYMWTRTA